MKLAARVASFAGADENCTTGNSVAQLSIQHRFDAHNRTTRKTNGSSTLLLIEGLKMVSTS